MAGTEYSQPFSGLPRSHSASYAGPPAPSQNVQPPSQLQNFAWQNPHAGYFGQHWMNNPMPNESQVSPPREPGFFDNPMNTLAASSFLGQAIETLGPQRGSGSSPQPGSPKTRRFFKKELVPEIEESLEESELGVVPNMARPNLAKLRNAMTRSLPSSRASQRGREMNINQMGRGVTSGSSIAGIMGQTRGDARNLAAPDLEIADIMESSHRKREGEYDDVLSIQQRQSMANLNNISRRSDQEIVRNAEIGSLLASPIQLRGMLDLADALYSTS